MTVNLTAFARWQRHLPVLLCGISMSTVIYVLSVGPALCFIAHIGSDLQFPLLHAATWVYSPMAEIVMRSPECVQSLLFDYIAIWGLTPNETAFFCLRASSLL